MNISSEQMNKIKTILENMDELDRFHSFHGEKDVIKFNSLLKVKVMDKILNIIYSK